MTCSSVIHPDGCPTGHRSAGACFCDCHSECGDCAECGKEFTVAELVTVIDIEGEMLVCFDCAFELTGVVRS